jgi:hypothetical protein
MSLWTNKIVFVRSFKLILFFGDKARNLLKVLGKKCASLGYAPASLALFRMEQRTLKSVNNCLNMNIYFYLETSGGKSYNLYLNVVYFYNTRVN